MKKNNLFGILITISLFLFGCSKAPVAESKDIASKDINSTLTLLNFQIPTKKMPALPFELENLEGEMVSLASAQDKVVFLNFWATFCQPCLAEMPSMEKLYQKFKDQGFEILAVNLGDSKEKVKDFMKKTNLTFQALLDDTRSVGASYDARSIPTTYIIGRNGDILCRTIGGRDWYSEDIINLFIEILKL